jgi:hypothetical protein
MFKDSTISGVYITMFIKYVERILFEDGLMESRQWFRLFLDFVLLASILPSCLGIWSHRRVHISYSSPRKPNPPQLAIGMSPHYFALHARKIDALRNQGVMVSRTGRYTVTEPS